MRGLSHRPKFKVLLRLYGPPGGWAVFVHIFHAYVSAVCNHSCIYVCVCMQAYVFMCMHVHVHMLWYTICNNIITQDMDPKT